MRETVRDTIKLSELLKEALPYYSFANPQEKERIIEVIFSELSLSENTLQYKCAKGFQALASRFIPSGGPTGWLSELLGQREGITMSIQELASVLQT